MGKASQAKKVARVACAAEPTCPSRRRWLWPAGLLAILVVGVIVIYVARGQSHPAPTPQIANESTTTTAPLSATVSAPATTAGASTTTTAGSSSSTTAASSSTASTTSVSTSTTAKP